MRTKFATSGPLRPCAFAIAAAFLLTGCLAAGYLKAKKDTPPPQMLNMSFPAGRLEATLNTVITFNGPGSWKRDAFWDEYVVTLRNPGSQMLIITDVGLTDYSGAVQSTGDNPWKLEKESKTLEERYHAAGVDFARYTAPGLLIAGGAAAIGIGTAGGGMLAGYAAVVGTAGLALVALPVYYGTVLTIDHHHKVGMEREFNRRRLALPLPLAPGETRTGSFFFPMVPSPRSLGLHWADVSGSGETVLALDFLRGLHLKAAAEPYPIR